MLTGMGRVMVTLLMMSLAPAWQAGAQPHPGRVPVLAELFTSEGCSSCPPADRILELLAREPPIDGVDVIIMSEHVTYWDHQGWRDPFGSSTFTARQQMYGALFKLQSVFTPQLVIDGTAQIVGTDIAGLKLALASAAAKPKPRLTVELRDDGPRRPGGDGVRAGPARLRRRGAGMGRRRKTIWWSRSSAARMLAARCVMPALSGGSARSKIGDSANRRRDQDSAAR